jgi:hypothetical protein
MRPAEAGPAATQRLVQYWPDTVSITRMKMIPPMIVKMP